MLHHYPDPHANPGIREAYVRMKAKEKGIDEKELIRGPKDGDDASSEKGSERSSSTNRNSSDSRHGVKGFNAFREMDKLRKGGVPQLAKIDKGVAVVGAPLNGYGGGAHGNDRKRKAEDEGEGSGRTVKAVSWRILLGSVGQGADGVDRRTNLTNLLSMTWSWFMMGRRRLSSMRGI
jgi:hypothetical protein